MTYTLHLLFPSFLAQELILTWLTLGTNPTAWNVHMWAQGIAVMFFLNFRSQLESRVQICRAAKRAPTKNMTAVPRAHMCTFHAVGFVPRVNYVSINSWAKNGFTEALNPIFSTNWLIGIITNWRQVMSAPEG